MTQIDTSKAGYITIIGRPNVGKSTLMNNLLDFRLSIISPRPQTTRKKIMGILNKPGFQIVFLDTPGLLVPKYQLQKVFSGAIETAISDADALVFMVECRKNIESDRHRIEDEIEDLKKVNPKNIPVILVINKVDLFSKSILLPQLEFYNSLYPFVKQIPVSALKKDGLKELEAEMEKLIPYHPPFYDPEIITEQPERFFVSEFIREQIFLHFHEEIPFSTEVQIEDFKERETGKDLIRATIYVERESQKGIIIGKKGSALKNIGLKSRKVIEKFLDREIYLELRVKVSKDWRKSEDQIRKFGY
ncbi:MAG: GTPase Era [Calditrichales bacterium]|nr:MAG: GTPase Era [Calditrichales bacterium]